MICENIERLIDYAIRNSLIEVSDVYVVSNMFMETFGLGDWESVSAEYSGEPVDELLQPLVDYAVENELIADTSNSRDLFDTRLNTDDLVPNTLEKRNDGVPNIFEKVPDCFKYHLAGFDVLLYGLNNTVPNAFEKVFDTLPNALKEIYDAVPNVFEKVSDAFKCGFEHIHKAADYVTHSAKNRAKVLNYRTDNLRYGFHQFGDRLYKPRSEGDNYFNSRLNKLRQGVDQGFHDNGDQLDYCLDNLRDCLYNAGYQRNYDLNTCFNDFRQVAHNSGYQFGN